jgi:hypothetical protein
MFCVNAISRSVSVAIVSALFFGPQHEARVQNPQTLPFQGKVLVGYQGWFRCPGDGSPRNAWSHWSRGIPSLEILSIDVLPGRTERSLVVRIVKHDDWRQAGKCLLVLCEGYCRKTLRMDEDLRDRRRVAADWNIGPDCSHRTLILQHQITLRFAKATPRRSRDRATTRTPDNEFDRQNQLDPREPGGDRLRSYAVK